MADSGSDNPILDMGLLGMMKPNPYLNPSLNTNPDGSPKPLALPGFYTGQSAGNMGPTNAMGDVIPGFTQNNDRLQAEYQKQLAAFHAAQSPPPGTTTLNMPPSGIGSGGQIPGGTIDYSKMGSAGPAVQELLGNYQASQAKLTPQQRYNQEQTRIGNANTMQQEAFQSAGRAGSGFGSSPGGAFNPGSDFSPSMLAGGGGGGAPAVAAGPTPPTPPDLRQTYLDALANPGPLPRPGAAVPASNPLGTPSVLNAFLTAHPSGGTKSAGGYDNTGFFNTLSNLRNA